MNIAIDGPSGAGKSTIAKQIAAVLKIIYLDTGAMYRAAGLKAYKTSTDLSDLKGIENLLDNLDIAIKYDNGTQKVWLDGEDVSTEIREHNISKMASDISAIPVVRYKMVDLQRQMASREDAVLDGRDIGTFVLPDAKYKFFLTASVDVRALRRYNELKEKGQDVELEKVKADMIQRDKNDSSRAVAPLKKADDAIEIDTSDLSINQVVEAILSYINI